VIATENLTIRVGSFVLRNLTLSVPEGGYGVLMGRTGAGKTTILEAICGLRPIAEGTVRIGDRGVSQLPVNERGIGYVPQDLALFPNLTVREHLGFALTIRQRPAVEVANRVAELAEMLGIGPLLDRKPRGLSGGEAQRVALGRALAHRPHVLLLDEPLSALDAETHSSLMEVLRGVQRQTGVTTLHVTHNPAEARTLASQVLRLVGGAIHTAEL
jgi:ABC-type sugar transport system ATPase subunit